MKMRRWAGGHGWTGIRAWVRWGLALAAAAVPVWGQTGWPLLPELAGEVRQAPAEAGPAARLASALMHHDWMLPVESTPEMVWRAGAQPRGGAEGGVTSPDGTRRLEWKGATLRLVSLPDGGPMAELDGVRPWDVMQWHPGGWVVALAGTNGVEIRDARTLRPATTELSGAAGPAMAFSPDGLWMATGRRGGGVMLWDWAVGRPLASGLPGWGRVDSVDFDASGTRLRVRAGVRQGALDARPGRAYGEWHGSTSAVQTVVFSRDARWVLATSADGWVSVRDAMRREKTVTFRLAGAPMALAWTEAGDWLVTALPGAKLRLWNTVTGRPVGSWLTHAGLRELHVSDNADYVWSVSTNSVRAWQPRTAALVPVEVLAETPVLRSVSDAGHRMIAVLGTVSNAPVVSLWKLRAPATRAATLPAWEGGILDLDPTGEWVLTTSTNGGLRQRRWAVGGTDPGRPDIGLGTRFGTARYSEDGRFVIGVAEGGWVRVWNAGDGRVSGSPIEFPGVDAEGVEVSPDGLRVRLEDGAGRVRIHDVATGRPVTGEWVSGRRGVRRVALRGRRFSADGAAVLVPQEAEAWRLAGLPPTGPAPGWLPRLAEAIWGSASGPTPTEMARLRMEVTGGEPILPWVSCGKWLVADRSVRPVTVSGGPGALELAERHLESGLPLAALEAYRLAPNVPLVREGVGRQLQSNGVWNRPYRAEQGMLLRGDAPGRLRE